MDDNYTLKVKSCKKIHEKARYYRGRFLNSVAVVERKISLIITEYFCVFDDSKRELFFTGIVEKLSLEDKKQILIKIVRKDYPKYWNDNKEFLNSLTKIQKFRNKLAHSIVDVSDEALSRPIMEGVGFIEWDRGRPITDNEFEDWEVKVNMLNSTLSDIEKLLPYKEKTE